MKKEWNVICSNMDATRGYHTKWSKSEKERQITYNITYMWDLKYGINETIYKIGTDSDRENTLLNAKGIVGEGEGWTGSLGLTDANY